MTGKRSIEGMTANRSIEGMTAKRSIEGMTAKRSIEGMTAKRSIEGMTAKRSIEGMTAKRSMRLALHSWHPTPHETLFAADAHPSSSLSFRARQAAVLLYAGYGIRLLAKAEDQGNSQCREDHERFVPRSAAQARRPR